MRFGVFTSMGGQTWLGVLELWRHSEATGWDVACVTDHFMPNTKEREGAMLEGWSTLTSTRPTASPSTRCASASSGWTRPARC